ncbi:hypothetical protein JWG44_13315 [Leptospira sp. 201903071]|uniref:hypothetical protein n=1 Tax=Leptospira ainazelensis TaxID=2810034 RepID=UPI001966C546|nr:hypothetical protein [Leptospira ainazelensis]MBM9501230.1 hypothetical protein [Leptospira ainazelensis]
MKKQIIVSLLLFSTLIQSEEKPTDQSRKYFYLDSSDFMKLYKEPSLRSKIEFYAPEGFVLEVVDQTKSPTKSQIKKKWVKVRVNNNFYYAHSPKLVEVKEVPKNFEFENRTSLSTKAFLDGTTTFEELVGAKLPEPYNPSRDKRYQAGDFKYNEFRIVSYYVNGRFSLIQISPTGNINACDKYLSSDCYNFILEDGEIVETDMHDISFGNVVNLTKKSAYFNVYGGEGDECSSRMENKDILILLKTMEIFSKDTVSFSGCDNKVKKTISNYGNVKVYKLLSKTEIRKIFRD